MDRDELVAKYLPILKKNWLTVSLGTLGLTFFIYGLIGFLGGSHSTSNEIIFESANTSSPSSQLNHSQIVVDIEGALVRPGVYKLSLDARIQDALIASGGLSSDADRNWVEKNLNLAAKLADGAKIYIPRIGESNVGSMGVAEIVGGGININTASEQELDSLPGIGPVTAQKIISQRPYSSIDDLLTKKIVSSKVFKQIKEKITIY